jgi:hypothetical protein
VSADVVEDWPSFVMNILWPITRIHAKTHQLLVLHGELKTDFIGQLFCYFMSLKSSGELVTFSLHWEMEAEAVSTIFHLCNGKCPKKILTYLLHGAESFLRSQLVLQLVKKFPAFLEPEGSSPYSQVPAT